MNAIHTFGYSTQTVEQFIDTLKLHAIDVVVDVRSVPYSKYTPQFNQEQIKKALAKANLQYLFFGKEFGARRDEPEAYRNGKVDFEAVKVLPSFLRGVERIASGLSKNYKIALACTEKNPLECHRFLLVSKALQDSLKIEVSHILEKTKLASQAELEKKMLASLNLQPDFFSAGSNNLNLFKAYHTFSERIEYKQKEATHA
jgi:uncharacterized protein (DUF488 family)